MLWLKTVAALLFSQGREATVAAVRRENTLPIEKRALGARGDEDEDDEDDDDEVMAEVLIGGGSSRLVQRRSGHRGTTTGRGNLVCRCSDERQPSSSGGPGRVSGGDLDPSRLIVAGGRLPSRRRFITGTSIGLVTALGANFLGLTSAILGAVDDGKPAMRWNLDVLFPVKGMKRCLDRDNGYTFTYPSPWLADQLLYQRYAKRVEQQNPLDPPSLRKAKQRRDPTEPTAAFGPPGSSGELNISCVVAPIEAGFALRSLGQPEEAGNLILRAFIAPPTQSDKSATLISASETGEGYYLLEYAVESASRGWKRRNLAVYGSSGGLLYTLNAQCPESQWQSQERLLREAALSFRILS